MGSIIEGGCFCKAVRYRLNAPPSGSMVCHCQSCCRVAGAPMVGWVTAARTDFQFTQGEPARLRSSRPVVRTFCSACGSGLTYESDRDPQTLDITTCSLDHPAAFPPTHHAWLSHALPWVQLGDGLAKFEQSRPG